MTWNIRFPASKEALAHILDNYHMGRAELRRAGVLETNLLEGDHFIFQMPPEDPKKSPERKLVHRRKPIHPGRWGHGD